MSIKFDKKKFSYRLRNIREARELTQVDLSEPLGISSSNISDYENEYNKKLPTLGNLCEIARQLNVSLDWLCGSENLNRGIDVMLSFIAIFQPEIIIKQDNNGIEYATFEMKGMRDGYSQLEIAKYLKTLNKIKEMKEENIATDKMIAEFENAAYKAFRHIPDLPDYDVSKEFED